MTKYISKQNLRPYSLFLILITSSLFATAQISVNETNQPPDPSAMLDVQSSDRGVLIPRMTDTQRLLIFNPAQGLLVYQNNGDQGFYFYDGSNWVGLNSGTSDEISDADNDTRIQVEKSADEDIIRFDLGGSEQFRMTDRRLEPVSSHTFFGQEAGMNNNFFGSPAGGNVGIGSQALKLNSIGYLNTAIGRQAMKDNTTGFSNTSVGFLALGKNSTSSENTAVGSLALRNTTGANNTAVGVQALKDNTSGTLNTGIGWGANVGNPNLTNATAIGANATVNSSNSLVLGDGARVGIGTSSPDNSALLELNSTSQGFLLPRLTPNEIVAINNPAEGLVVYNTARKKPIYFDGNEWRSYDGTNALYYQIGEFHAGGIIFYVDGTGLHGIVCSINTSAIASSPGGFVKWGCPGIDITDGNGASGTTVGTGQANSNAILSAVNNSTCPIDPNFPITFPAALHIDNFWMDGGYSDWYLPSKDELNLMIQNQGLFNTISLANGGNGISTGTYWSSTENTSSQAYAQSTSGSPSIQSKTSDYLFWPVRSF